MDAVFLDFEFNRTTHPLVNLVSCVTHHVSENYVQTKRFWLHNNEENQKRLAAYLTNLRNKGVTVVGYAAVAEARAMLSLGLDIRTFEFIDLFFEYRCLSNHNDDLNWGKQLVDGKVVTVRKPKPRWERTEEDKGTGFRPTHSLAEATYKLTGHIRDSAHKDQMRNLIISDPDVFSVAQREAILKYNEEDVVHLPELWATMRKWYLKKDPSLRTGKLISEAKIRGRYAMLTALMESRGYPIDVEKTKNFSAQVPVILWEAQREINSYFPDIAPFKWNKRENRFNWNQKKTREVIAKYPFADRWMRTQTDQLSLSLEAFQRFFDFKHDYPTDNFGAQMVRFLKLKQSLNGFIPSPDKSKKTFWNSVGPDGRVRAYLNPYGAQSSRTQPGATGFLFLKPAWMRALCTPTEGNFMAGIDYGSQEFLIQALDAEDENMIEAYRSGDPYLYLGKQAGAIPPEGTKDSHKFMRDVFKSVTLGISYLMSKYGLAIKLSAETGREWDEDEAQDLIDQFYEVYDRLGDYQQSIVDNYLDQGFLKLYDGWYVFGDNDNPRSITNVPTQGKGAAIMRDAVYRAEMRNVRVIKTLHDAIYIEGERGNEKDVEVLAECMREAFVAAFPKHLKSEAELIRLDPFLWGPGYPEGEMKVGGITIETGPLYIDQRAIKDYQRFSNYFQPPESDLI